MSDRSLMIIRLELPVHLLASVLVSSWLLYARVGFFFLMIRRPPRSTLDRSSAASDVYKRQVEDVDAEAVQHGVLRLRELLDDVVDARVALREAEVALEPPVGCLLYTSPSPRDRTRSRMPSSA